MPQALAATSILPPDYPQMRMQVVRSNDPACANRCSDWIMLDGTIGLGSAAKFAKFIRKLGARRLPVLINSSGGSVRDAMAIGHLIRAKHLDVAVSRTEFTSCPSERVACAVPSTRDLLTARPVAFHAICASACSLILAGGERRFVPLNAFVGVHQFRTFRNVTRVMRTFQIRTRTANGITTEVSRTLVAVHPVSTTNVAVKTTAAMYSGSQQYFDAMGISPTLMSLAESTASDSIHWLTLAELVSTRMGTEGRDGAYLIAHPTIDPAGPPARSASNGSVESSIAAAPPRGEESATLISEDGDDRTPLHLDGYAVWSVDPMPSCPALIADIDLPDGAGGATVRIVDLGERPGVPDYRIKLTLRPLPQSPFRHVSAVGLPAVRIVATQPPVELEARVDGPELGTYDIDLNTNGPGAGSNRMAMKMSRALEFPLVAYPLRKLRVTLTLGASGRDAFTRWRALVDEAILSG